MVVVIVFFFLVDKGIMVLVSLVNGDVLLFMKVIVNVLLFLVDLVCFSMFGLWLDWEMIKVIVFFKFNWCLNMFVIERVVLYIGIFIFVLNRYFLNMLVWFDELWLII